jgi:hypothetical protein
LFSEQIALSGNGILLGLAGLACPFFGIAAIANSTNKPIGARMKKYLAIFAATVTLAASPAFAQNAAPMDPATVAATKQMIEAMHIRDVMIISFQQVLTALPERMRAALTKMINDDPKASPEHKRKALANLDEELPKMVSQLHSTFSDPTLVDDMIAEIIPLYARTYTVSEIQQLSAFYQSPLGQKMLANMPKLMVDSMEITNRLMLPRLQKAMNETAQRFGGKAL